MRNSDWTAALGVSAREERVRNNDSAGTAGDDDDAKDVAPTPLSISASPTEGPAGLTPRVPVHPESTGVITPTRMASGERRRANGSPTTSQPEHLRIELGEGAQDAVHRTGRLTNA